MIQPTELYLRSYLSFKVSVICERCIFQHYHGQTWKNKRWVLRMRVEPMTFQLLVIRTHYHWALAYSEEQSFHSQGVCIWRVESSGVRQSKIYKVTIGSERVKGDSFETFHSQGVSIWRVESSGFRQSKLYKVTLGSERVKTRFKWQTWVLHVVVISNIKCPPPFCFKRPHF